jgi:phospholipase C
MAFSQKGKQRAAAVASVMTLVAQLMSPAFAAENQAASTRTPIKHVIVIIGENLRSCVRHL